MSLLNISIWILWISNHLDSISNSLANKLGLSYDKLGLRFHKYLHTLNKSWIIAFRVLKIAKQIAKQIAFRLLPRLLIIAFANSVFGFENSETNSVSVSK